MTRRFLNTMFWILMALFLGLAFVQGVRFWETLGRLQ